MSEKTTKTSVSILKWQFIGLLTLGFLIGNLIGLSANNHMETIMASLFAISGGVTILSIKNEDLTIVNLKLRALFFIALGCLIGVYFGIYLSESKSLTPDKTIVAGKETEEKIIDRKYLRSQTMTFVELIDQQLTNEEITVEEAYNELFEHINTNYNE